MNCNLECSSNYFFHKGVQKLQKFSDETQIHRDIIELVNTAFKVAWDYTPIPKYEIVVLLKGGIEWITKFDHATRKPILTIDTLVNTKHFLGNSKECLNTIDVIAKTAKKIFKMIAAWEYFGYPISTGAFGPQIPMIIAVCSLTHSIIKSANDKNSWLDMKTKFEDGKYDELKKIANDQFKDEKRDAGFHINDNLQDGDNLKSDWNQLLDGLDRVFDSRNQPDEEVIDFHINECNRWLESSEPLRLDPVISIGRRAIEYAIISLAARKRDKDLANRYITKVVEGKREIIEKLQRDIKYSMIIRGLDITKIAVLTFADQYFKLYDMIEFGEKLVRVWKHYKEKQKSE